MFMLRIKFATNIKGNCEYIDKFIVDSGQKVMLVFGRSIQNPSPQSVLVNGNSTKWTGGKQILGRTIREY
jgi:hypothetical protein